MTNHKVSSRGTTESNGQTNKETIEMPLLIIKAKTALLLGLDWMQRLKRNLGSNNDAIQIHNKKNGQHGKQNNKTPNDFKDIFSVKKRKENSLLK